MDKVKKQRSNIVLYREKRDGEHYIRIEYAGDPAIALLLPKRVIYEWQATDLPI